MVAREALRHAQLPPFARRTHGRGLRLSASRNRNRCPYEAINMNDNELLPICASLESFLGVPWYHRFLCSAAETRTRGRLWFWQEEMLRRFQAATGIAIASADELVALL